MEHRGGQLGQMEHRAGCGQFGADGTQRGSVGADGTQRGSVGADGTHNWQGSAAVQLEHRSIYR